MTMRTIPVDLGKLAGFTLALEPAPYTDRETGEVRRDRESGLPLYLLGVNVSNPAAREAYCLMIQVAGEPAAGLALNQVVKVDGLTASPWDRDGRSGVTYRASAITPATAPAPTPAAPAAADAAASRAGGERGRS